MFKLILSAFLLITASCSNDQSKSESEKTQQHEETNQTQLKLNNGQKWKLDEATRRNMKEIKAQISQATHASGGLSGDELLRQANILIKECRMTGPGHDALHAWLGTFLEHVRALKTNRDAEWATHSLNEDVKIFDTYFE